MARPWTAPAEGPAPVIEILRDGSWLLDGEAVEGGGDARSLELMRRMVSLTQRMPDEPLFSGHDEGPRIPSNPVILRVDRDAPWESMRSAIRTCHSACIEITGIELAAGAEEADLVRCLPIPMTRDVGSSCSLLAANQHVKLILEQQGTLSMADGTPIRSPVELSFEISLDKEGDPEHPTEERFSSADALFARMEDLCEPRRPDPDLRAPGGTPAWIIVAALDAGTRIHPDIWEFSDP